MSGRMDTSVGAQRFTTPTGSLGIDRPSKIVAVGLNYHDHA